MTMQNSIALRNATLDARETAIGTAPKLQFRTGAQPANCATARSGTLLSELTLPSDWLSNAASGVKSLLGTWASTGLPAAGAGTTIGYYSIMDSAGTTCHEQGSVTVTGGGGDMTVDNVSIASGQAISVTTYQLTAPGA